LARASAAAAPLSRLLNDDAVEATTATPLSSPPPPTKKRWLIAIAYWLAGGFIKSGLGNRIAYSMVAAFGKTTLGLTYALVLGEALLSPMIPSVAARAGGIFFPLAKALCLACGSDPDKGTEKKMGAYVMKTCFQVGAWLWLCGCGLCVG
jgi:di/tricarboxylate transporter